MNNSDIDLMRQNSNAAHPVDATLRLIVHAPIPEGIEQRIHERLRSAPRRGELKAWPTRIDSNWLRSAAAAAIVAIVAGGGWGVYSHAGHQQAAKAIVQPATAGQGGGFSSAGAMRTPQTVHGPVLKNPAKNPTGKSAKKTGTASVELQTDATQKPVQPADHPAAR